MEKRDAREPDIPSGQIPLEVLERLRRNGALNTHGAEHAARSLPLPVAAVRGAVSWYADLHADPDAIRVCRGTSCMLAGAHDLLASLARHHKCRHMYCAGYCDRSPAVLTSHDQVVIRCGANVSERLLRSDEGSSDNPSKRPPMPPPPDVRCTARRPIVTGRLLCGGCHELSGARAAGVYTSLEQALRAPPERILETIEQSGI